MATKELRTLEELPIGRRFMLPECEVRGKLLDKGVGSATVEIERNGVREFATRDGRHVRIKKARERAHWSLGTIVEIERRQVRK